MPVQAWFACRNLAGQQGEESRVEKKSQPCLPHGHLYHP